MKNIILGLLFFCCTSIVKAQEYSDKTVTTVVDVKGASKSDLFASINKWVSLNYNSAKDVLQLNDKESGTIIIKGNSTISFDNDMKQYSKNNRYTLDVASIPVNHTIEINVKNEKFRTVITYTGFVSRLQSSYNFWNDDVINLEGNEGSGLERMLQDYDDLFRGALIGKKKRAKYVASTKKNIQNLNKSLVEHSVNINNNLKSSILETSKDGW